MNDIRISIIEPIFLYHIKEITKVVDGDTIHTIVDRGFGDFSYKTFRLASIDTWETRGKYKVLGNRAKQFLKDLLEEHKDKVITVRSVKAIRKGKYGRYLGHLYVGDIYVNKLLVDKGHQKTKW